MDTDIWELNEVLLKVANRGMTVQYEDYGIEFIDYRNGHEYFFLYPTKALSPEVQLDYPNQLADGVRWRKI